MNYLFLALSFYTFGLRSDLQSNDKTEVYICNSKTSTKYHYKKDCRGIKNCKSKIIKITKQKAKDDERTLCGWED